MSRQIQPARVLAEGVVIVASILLAFGIDAGWEEYRTRREISGLLTKVNEELVADRGNLVRAAGDQITAAMAALAVADLLDSAAPLRTPVMVPDSLLAAMLRGVTYESRTPTIDGLTQSGRGSLIGDTRVVRAIAAWERWMRNAEEQQLARTEWTHQQVIPALARRADVGHILRAGISARLMRDGDDVQGLGPPPQQLDPTGATSIQADPEIEALISQQARASAVARSSFLLAVSSTDSLIAAIGARR